MWPARLPASRALTRLGAAFVVLLAIRFFASVSLSALAPPADVLTAAARFLDAYEIVLPAAVLPVLFLLSIGDRRGTGLVVWLCILGGHVAAFLVWLGGLFGLIPSFLFVPSAVALVVLAAGLVFPRSKVPEWLRGRWWGMGYLAMLVVIPLGLSLRAGAASGLGTSPGPGGTLVGSWLVSNLPTLLMELLAIGVWLAVLLGMRGRELRRRWYAFLPFAAVPVPALALSARDLAGYILSATVTWGSNLTVFAPTIVSLTIVALAIACYLSTFLLAPRKGHVEAWSLVLLGSLSIILAGLYLSMASVEGLVWGLLLVARGLSRWEPTSI